MSALFLSCTSSYYVEGSSSITGLDGKKLFLKSYEREGWVNVDSAEVLHGLFDMEGPVDTVRMVTLYMDGESIMPLVLEAGKVQVAISNSQLLAKGTPLNDRLYTFIKKHNAMEVAVEDVERKEARMILEGANIDEIHEQLQQEKEQLQNDMEAYVKKFILDNTDNVLGPSVFMMMCNMHPYPILTPQIQSIVDEASDHFKSNPLVKAYLMKAEENMQYLKEQGYSQQGISSLPY